MTGNRIKVSSINDHIWLLNDNNEATGYVIAGSERALIIDTMNGYEDVAAIAKSITVLPLTVVNTHGHPDHIYGNIFFEEAYINPRDMALQHIIMRSHPFLTSCRKQGRSRRHFCLYRKEIPSIWAGWCWKCMNLLDILQEGSCCWIEKTESCSQETA